MDNTYEINGYRNELAEYETPFADIPVMKEDTSQRETNSFEQFQLGEFESPFASTYEASTSTQPSSPQAAEFVQFLGELHDSEFENNLYELAGELEDSWSNKISNEAAMGDRMIPFATQQASEYFAPFISETEAMIDKVSRNYSGNNLADHSEAEIERFFSELEFDHGELSPAQEQFFGSIFNKVKSVVSKGVELAKKGISAVGKILPVGMILNKLKGLIRPLLDKVLRFAIGKLPIPLRPFARNLARKFLNLETESQETEYENNEVPTSGELEAIQTELNTQIAQLVFAPGETEAEQVVMEYEGSADTLQREYAGETGSVNMPSLDAARQQFINELKQLQPGQSAAPAIERFLPVAIMALRPVVKIALSIIGRQKVIDFLAGLLANLVGKYVPDNIARPLASSIIDIGMTAIGFETYETNRSDVAYEAIANTITDTIREMGELNEQLLNDQEALAAETLEAFETAVANNFPAKYLRENLRTAQQGVWVLKPRKGPGFKYRKYSQIFNVTIDPQTLRSVTTFRGLPLSSFLRDKLGIDPSRPIQARVHLFEAIHQTRLNQIARYENIPGLTVSRQAYVLFHPLTTQAAALLVKDPSLGRNYSRLFTTNRYRIAQGQRFFYLEITGTRLRTPVVDTGNHRHSSNVPVAGSVPHSSDIQGVINFIKSEIRLNYYFSEEEAKAVVQKLNRNDYLGAALSIRYSVRNVLNNILIQNIGNKVKIIHEAVPELYLDNYTTSEQEGFLGGIAMDAGKAVLMKIVEKLIDKLTDMAYQAMVNYFKARAAEFKQAQASNKDGVTVRIIWINVPGMSTIRAIFNAVRGKFSLGNLADLALPNIPTPVVEIKAGKQFN